MASWSPYVEPLESADPIDTWEDERQPWERDWERRYEYEPEDENG